jgi:hypothetical protein
VPGSLGTGTPPVVSLEMVSYCMEYGIQISPDSVQYPLEGCKNVNFPCAAAPFTVSPVPRASTCCAALPRESALYAVERLRPAVSGIRRLASLHSGFLQTPPHGDALAIG